MFFKLFYALAILTYRRSVYGHTPDALDDEITEMPGLDHDPGFRQFSGYLHISDTDKYIFYWYVESQSRPEHDPVAYWTNGGPGCSGLYGFGTEMGPFIFGANGTVSRNPYSWNRISNMLFVEQPAGVGFSYSNNPDDYHTGDHQAVLDQYAVILAFFDRFPEVRPNEFYIASESYGGHYMPQLALTLVNEATDINFKGFTVGNPWAVPAYDYPAFNEMYYYRGLISQPLYDRWLEHGCDVFLSRDEARCLTIETEIYYAPGTGINPYALDYPICIDYSNSDQYGFLSSMGKTSFLSPQGSKLLDKTNPKVKQVLDDYEPCAFDYLTEYLSRDDVQDAINAMPTETWEVCSDAIYFGWDDTFWDNQLHYYQELIDGRHGLKMLVFSGDDDAVCPTSATQKWIFRDLGVHPKETCSWDEWKVNGQTAGYLTEFDIQSNSGSFHFLTVHSAGHEVPTYKPAEAFDLWTRYLSGNWNLAVEEDGHNFAPDDYNFLSTQ